MIKIRGFRVYNILRIRHTYTHSYINLLKTFNFFFFFYRSISISLRFPRGLPVHETRVTIRSIIDVDTELSVET